MKGKFPQAEIDRLPPTVSLEHTQVVNVPGLDAQRCLVWMKPVTL
jgi:16S rRNA (guanine527-N7)-methyltransferase